MVDQPDTDPTDQPIALHDTPVGAIRSWTCPTSVTVVSTDYCPTCGERPLDASELTLRGLVDQIFHALTSIDSRLIRSFLCLFARPGFLTVAYLQGRRKPYIGPVPLFLMANVLFFATESLLGGTAFTTPLDWHLHNQPWSAFAETAVAHHLEATQTTLDEYTPVFDRAVAINARSFIIFMALSFALLPAVVFQRRKIPAAAHAVFSLHVYAFLLLLLCVATAIPAVDLLFGGAGFASQPLDYAISSALLLAWAAYLYVAIGMVYGATGAMRVVQAVVLAIGVATIVLGYRFALFLLTLYTA